MKVMITQQQNDFFRVLLLDGYNGFKVHKSLSIRNTLHFIRISVVSKKHNFLVVTRFQGRLPKSTAMNIWNNQNFLIHYLILTIQPKCLRRNLDLLLLRILSRPRSRI